MNARRARSGLLRVGLVSALFVSCAGNQEQRVTASAELAESASLLGIGDVVEISVFREPELKGVYRVTQEGTLDFPLIGKLTIKGKNADQVADEIRTRLSEGYLKDPRVSVFIRERHSQKVHVLGQVARPGTFNYEPGMMVIQAITLAGGFGKLASSNSVRVTRTAPDGREQTFEVRAGAIGEGSAPNFELRPGDIIFVPEALF